ncbi:MAG: D-tyrosyl-tRNA(Tyr) deacylase [Clostridiales bacterium]|nr:D-tyrosyl-tRNA(Tyr) deacylase [Clostridiales bacterium]
MKALIQRVNFSKMQIDEEIYSEISKGFLVLLGVEAGDTEKDFDYIKKKIINLRIFEDENEKMNLNIKQVNGEIMLVSQFTLCADTSQGNRPSFINAEKPERANEIYEKMINEIRKEGIKVETGKFGAHMKINFENDGPVTIMLQSK